MSKINLHILQSPDLYLVLSQLGHLTLDYVENFPKKYDLLKKLAFAEVYILVITYQVTLYLVYVCNCLTVDFFSGYTLDLLAL